MNKYQIEINGKNFLIDMNGEVSKYGFITYRYIEANDPQEAELQVMQMLRETEKLRNMVQNTKEDPPEMYMTEIEEIESFDQIEEMEPGFIWYKEQEKK